jgi:hypothetical protein
MSNVEYSIAAQTGGLSAKIAVSGTSARSGSLNDQSFVVVTSDVDVFFRRGSVATALADGTDQLLRAYQTYRLYGFSPGDKLAFITAGTSGFVYITPGA